MKLLQCMTVSKITRPPLVRGQRFGHAKSNPHFSMLASNMRKIIWKRNYWVTFHFLASNYREQRTRFTLLRAWLVLRLSNLARKLAWKKLKIIIRATLEFRGFLGNIKSRGLFHKKFEVNNFALYICTLFYVTSASNPRSLNLHIFPFNRTDWHTQTFSWDIKFLLLCMARKQTCQR